MWMLITRGIIAGAVIVGVTVFANRHPKWGAFLLTLPLVSILAFLSIEWVLRGYHAERVLMATPLNAVQIVKRLALLKWAQKKTP